MLQKNLSFAKKHMARISLSNFLIAFVFLILISSCVDNPPDLTPPEIDILSISPAPGSGLICGEIDNQLITINPGDSLVLNILMTDDEGLSQYKVDIHPNFDCHGHRTLTSDWSIQQITDLHGVLQTEETIIVRPPANVTAGIYHMAIRLVDLAGNEDQDTRYYNLFVYNPFDTIKPDLNITTPAEQIMQVSRGTVLNFSGILSDNLELSYGGNARIELTYIGENSNLRLNAFKHTLSHIQETEYHFDIPYTVPQTLTPGTYFYTIEAFDGVNNPSEYITFEFEIVP